MSNGEAFESADGNGPAGNAWQGRADVAAAGCTCSTPNGVVDHARLRTLFKLPNALGRQNRAKAGVR